MKIGRSRKTHKEASVISRNGMTGRKSRLRGWFKFLLYLTLFITVIVLAGFISFVYKVGQLKPPQNVTSVDGIVVWTGKGGDRLKNGAALLKAKKGERLLISGVNEALTAAQVYGILGIEDKTAQCCIDLDYDALDTIGNARETSNWARAMGYEHIVLVTSAYHMPRAELEIAAANGQLQVTPYPVSSEIEQRWWQDPAQFKRILQEYGKLVLANIRQAGQRAENRTPRL